MNVETFPTRRALQRPAFSPADFIVLLGVIGLLLGVAWVGSGTVVPFLPPENVPRIDLDPGALPYYAARSTLRMFLALAASLLFTLVYGYAAAHSKRAWHS